MRATEPTRAMRRFARSALGATSAEFALVATVFIMIVFGAIDLARLAWHVNAATTATQKGVRHAVVNPYVSDVYPVDGLGLGYDQGLVVPISDTSVNDRCRKGPTDTRATCTVSNQPREAAFEAIVTAMDPWYWGVDDATVVVTYDNVELGFVGNPFGSDVVPLVTVALEGLEFNLLTPFVSAMNPISLPTFAASLTAEDGQ